jgi:hypothetical protein
MTYFGATYQLQVKSNLFQMCGNSGLFHISLLFYSNITYQNPITGFLQTITFQENSISSNNICFSITIDTTKRNVEFEDKKRTMNSILCEPKVSNRCR